MTTANKSNSAFCSSDIICLIPKIDITGDIQHKRVSEGEEGFHTGFLQRRDDLQAKPQPITAHVHNLKYTRITLMLWKLVKQTSEDVISWTSCYVDSHRYSTHIRCSGNLAVEWDNAGRAHSVKGLKSQLSGYIGNMVCCGVKWDVIVFIRSQM